MVVVSAAAVETVAQLVADVEHKVFGNLDFACWKVTDAVDYAFVE